MFELTSLHLIDGKKVNKKYLSEKVLSFFPTKFSTNILTFWLPQKLLVGKKY